MTIQALKGLEMMCLTKDGYFALSYGGKGEYTNPKGEPVKDLMDMGCPGCGSAYFTREKGMIDFCPACGFMERKRFTKFQDLQKWSNEQNWSFLKLNKHKAFGVLRHGEWRLAFARDGMELEVSGHYDEVHDLLS